MPPKIAFIGLGSMGGRMTHRLLEAGLDVAVYDVVPERREAFADRARIAHSIEDAIRGADAIFSVVPADHHSEAVVRDILPAASPGQVYVDFSTIGAWTITALADALAAVGVSTISAGMTRSIDGATTGTLSLYIGGVDSIPTALRPAFDAIATDFTYVGSVGAAKASKLVNNMVVTGLGIAITESLALGRRFGLGYRATVDAIIAAGGTSWTLDNHVIAHVLTDDLGPGFFSTNLVRKDMRLYSRFAEELGVPAYFAGLALSDYRGSAAAGHGEDYHPIVVRWFEEAGHVGQRPTSQPPEGMDEVAVARTIAEAAVAIQSLVSAEALDALGRMGLTPQRAAEIMIEGTAGNGSFDEFVRGRTDGPLLSDVLERLKAVSALLDAADMPGAVFEIARHRTIASRQQHGGDAPVWAQRT